MKRKVLISLAFIIVWGAGIGIGYFFVNHQKVSAVSASTSIQVRANLPQFKLIDPLLFSQGQKSTLPFFVVLQNLLTSYIASTTKGSEASSVSIYFRQLNTGQWTGVNENDTYTPASMLKVIAMMATLQLAESNSSILNESLPYFASSTAVFDQYYEPNDHLKNGYYSAEDLVAAMIEYSDNIALYGLLSDSRINNEFTQIYNLFRLPAITATTTSDYMSPKSYSALFISLYNSTLFPWDLSEQVLNLLTNTTFTQGIVAGVPSDITVAHKFGESSDVASDGTIKDRQLHDCGIIYYPNNPYLLCIMTRGQDYPTLAGVIAGASNLVYNYVNGKSF